MNTARAIPSQGSRMQLTGLWDEDKVFAPEGAVLEVLNSAYYPALANERWVMHDGMWIFTPTVDSVM